MLLNLHRSKEKWRHTLLFDKYNIYSYDYIEYPHKSFWSDHSGEDKYKRALLDHFAPHKMKPTVFYLHIPFCQQMCWFCVCHFSVTQDYDRVKNYLKFLYKEMHLLKDFFQKNGLKGNFVELHLGGGSPTYVKESEFDELMSEIGAFVDFKNLAEFTIEIDPRRVDRERMLFYQKKGINRISFGVQDFDPQVQKAINRVQPPELIEKLLAGSVRDGFESINFDLLIGLPYQTVETVTNTANQVVQLGPDRVALAFMHYGPKHAPHQRLLKKEVPLPTFTERKILFDTAVAILLKNGYIRTGFEHFAKPTDSVAKALENKQVFYNSLGATPGRSTDLLGLGLHSYSRIGERFYSQSVYEFRDYECLLDGGIFPIFRAHELTDDDIIRRDLINRLRSYLRLDIPEFEKLHGIQFKTYFAKEENTLGQFEKDGLIKRSKEWIEMTDTGKLFSNVVCRIFDHYAANQHPVFFDSPKVEL